MVYKLPAGRLQTILNDFHEHRQSAIDISIELWVTAEDVAQHLGVAKDTVYRWRERKGLPAHRVGRRGSFSCPKWMSGCEREVPMKNRAMGANKNESGRGR